MLSNCLIDDCIRDSTLEDQLVCLLMDFFVAGSETTANTLAFGILYMILNPEIQEKVYKEIIQVVGEKGAPILEHRSQ